MRPNSIWLPITLRHLVGVRSFFLNSEPGPTLDDSSTLVTEPVDGGLHEHVYFSLTTDLLRIAVVLACPLGQPQGLIEGRVELLSGTTLD